MRSPLPRIFVCAMAVLVQGAPAAMDKTQAHAIAAEKGMSGKSAEDLVRALVKSGASRGAGPSVPMASGELCLENAKSNPPEGGDSDIPACGFANMAKIPGHESCIDRFEWPNVPCSTPVTWASAREADEICRTEGKRLCDAQEWESSCSDRRVPAPYEAPANNPSRDTVWSYGNERRSGICAMGSRKSPGCDRALASGRGVREACGTNAWPSGFFPSCKTKSGVYDMHGNVAEHMNLPREPSESTANGGSGVTEMKGSWFAFPDSPGDSVHPDDCLWREPGWHRTLVSSPSSHSNYHLGFRCCANPPEARNRQPPR